VIESIERKEAQREEGKREMEGRKNGMKNKKLWRV
jgi:hypothetical protein